MPILVFVPVEITLEARERREETSEVRSVSSIVFGRGTGPEHWYKQISPKSSSQGRAICVFRCTLSTNHGGIRSYLAKLE